MLGNWGLVAILGWSWTWAVGTGGNKVWNSVWLRSHFWEAVWGGDLRMSDFGVQCFQEKCGESNKQGRGRSWVGCGLSGSLAFADPRGSPYWTTEWHRGQFLNLFVSLWLPAVGGREDSCEPSTANTLFFNLLRNLRTLFHGAYANLHSLQQCTRVPCPLYPRQCLLSPVLLIIAQITVVGCYLSVVLICISLMMLSTFSWMCWLFVCLL